MPYPERLRRYNIIGKVPSGDELVHTVWMQNDVAQGRSLQDSTNAVRDQWLRLMSPQAGDPVGFRSLIATGTVYNTVNGYAVDTLGKATEQRTAAFDPFIAGTGTNAMPPQVALVVSLLTSRPGRSGRGRMYLGGLTFNSAVIATGRLQPANRDTISAALAGFYSRLRDINGPDVDRPVVVSPTLGIANKIVAVSVGDVYDTMRSRRNGLVEARVSDPVDLT